MENFSEQTSELLQSKTASQSRSAAVPASSPCHAYAQNVSGAGGTRVPQDRRPEQQHMHPLCKSQTSLYWFPNHPAPQCYFSILYNQERSKGIFSGYVGEVSTPLALVHEHKHTRIPDSNLKALKDFYLPQNSTD